MHLPFTRVHSRNGAVETSHVSVETKADYCSSILSWLERGVQVLKNTAKQSKGENDTDNKISTLSSHPG